MARWRFLSVFCLNDYRVPFYLSHFVLLAFFRISYNVPSRSRLVSPEGKMKVLLLLLTPARSGRMTLLNIGSDHYLVHWTMLVSKRSLINGYSRMEGRYISDI